MDRKEYWNEKYMNYFKELIEDANQEGEITTIKKESAGDYKTPGEKVLIDFFELLKSKETDRLLDYGCGTGRFYPYFSARSDYYGIDISQAMIKECQKAFPQAKNRFVVAEGEELPFADCFFNKLICYGVFDACYQEDALAEMIRVCNVGGNILISGKNINYFSDDEQALIAEEAARKKQHPNYFTDIRTMLDQLKGVAEAIETRYFLYRGDFAQGKYVADMPEHFYEWAVILRKTTACNAIAFEQFSDAYSNTWRKRRQV